MIYIKVSTNFRKSVGGFEKTAPFVTNSSPSKFSIVTSGEKSCNFEPSDNCSGKYFNDAAEK